MPGEGTLVEVGDRPAVRLVAGERRVTVRIVMTRAGRGVDLSRRPSAVLRCLGQGTDRDGAAHADADADADALRGALDHVARIEGVWRPRAGAVDLLGELGGAAFPLLGAAYDRGTTSLAEVPVWAAPIVSCPEPGPAARAAFGAAATRRTARSLAGALARGARGTDGTGRPGPPGLGALALAVAGARVLDGDRIARLLDDLTAGPGCERVLTVDELGQVGVVLDALAPGRAARVLTEAGTTDRGVDRLVEVGRLWSDVAPRLPRRLPPDLVGLRDVCRSLVVTDRRPARPVRVVPATGHPPSSRSAPPRRAAPAPPLPAQEDVADLVAPCRGAGPAARREDRVVRRQEPPPPSRTQVGPATPLALLPWVAPIHHQERDGVQLVLPRTVGDLERWGRLLRTCVGDFGPAAVDGTAALVGLFAGPRLIGCLHLSPERTIVQMLGRANRPLPASVRRAVLGLLTDADAVSPHVHANRPWFATS